MVDPGPVVEELRLHLPIAREGGDPEGAHQVRVATRRLRGFLELQDMRALADDLRWLRNAAQRVRDIDVVTAANPPEPFRCWLCDQRAPARSALLHALDSPRTGGLTQALSLIPPGDEALARKRTKALAKRVAKLATVLDEQEPELDELHRLRRAIRRLRYALEWLGDDAKPVKRVQEALGELGDVRATFELLEEFPEAGDLGDFQRELWARVHSGHHKARKAWRKARTSVIKVRS